MCLKINFGAADEEIVFHWMNVAAEVICQIHRKLYFFSALSQNCYTLQCAVWIAVSWCVTWRAKLGNSSPFFMWPLPCFRKVKLLDRNYLSEEKERGYDITGQSSACSANMSYRRQLCPSCSISVPPPCSWPEMTAEDGRSPWVRTLTWETHRKLLGPSFGLAYLCCG